MTPAADILAGASVTGLLLAFAGVLPLWLPAAGLAIAVGMMWGRS